MRKVSEQEKQLIEYAMDVMHKGSTDVAAKISEVMGKTKESAQTHAAAIITACMYVLDNTAVCTSNPELFIQNFVAEILSEANVDQRRRLGNMLSGTIEK